MDNKTIGALKRIIEEVEEYRKLPANNISGNDIEIVKDMLKQECEHKNIIITEKKCYHIPRGWDELQDQKDVDMGEYLINGDIDAVFCEDCGEYLNS